MKRDKLVRPLLTGKPQSTVRSTKAVRPSEDEIKAAIAKASNIRKRQNYDLS